MDFNNLLKYIICSESFIISASISVIPKAVSFCNLNSKIDSTCSLLNWYLVIDCFFSIREINLTLFLIVHFLLSRFFLAVSVSLDDLIIFIIASIFSTAVAIPMRMWALSSVFFKSNFILLTTVFSLKSTNSEINSLRFRTLGLPFTIAKVLKPKEDSIDVSLYSCLLIVSGSTPLLKSTTTLIPSRLDSSLISLTPSIFFSLERSAIFSFKTDLLT